MTTKEKVLEHLAHEAATDADMAEAFHMPEASVRRSRNELVKEGKVSRCGTVIPALWQASIPHMELVPEPVVVRTKKKPVEMRATGEAKSKPDGERPVPSQYYVF